MTVTAPWARKRKQRGFSMIEFMIVFIIVGVLAALAFGNWRTASVNTKSANSAESFLVSIRQARIKAIETGTIVTVTVANGSIKVSSTRPSVLSSIITLDSGVTVTGVTTFVFNPSGIATTNGTINFGNGKTVSVSMAGQATIN